jgi:hypothetical protein
LTIAEFLKKLKENHLSFHPHQADSQQPNNACEKRKIKVVDEREIASQNLVEYLSEKRKISLDVTRRFCKEIDFTFQKKFCK